MATLDNLINPQEDTSDLKVFNAPSYSTVIPPSSAIKARAASTALLAGDPEKAVEQYQLMVAEGEAGGDQITKGMQTESTNIARKMDMQTMTSVMSDPTIPYERKKQIVDVFNNSNLLKEPNVQLATNALAQGSKGETEDNERARLTIADAIGEVHRSNQLIQGLVNAHVSQLDWKNAKTIADTGVMFLAPFGQSISVAKVSENQRKAGESVWETIKGLLPGFKITEIREKLASLPPAERERFTASLINSISKKSGIIFSSENQFAQMQMMSQVFSDEGYGNVDKWIDNISVLLDVVGLGAFVRFGKTAAKTTGAAQATQVFPAAEKAAVAPFKALGEGAPVGKRISAVEEQVKTIKEGPPGQLTAIADAIRRIEVRSITHTYNPSSPAGIIQQTNPEKSRALFEAVFKSEGDAVAEGLYGTSRIEAIAGDVLPQIVTESGRVVSKPMDIERNIRNATDLPEDISNALQSSGALQYTRGEKAAARANKINQFAAAEGLHINSSMGSFTIDGGQFKISAVYGTPEGAFSNAEQAYTQALLSLRGQGVLPEEITILKKDGIDHVPVKLEDVKGVEGNYLVRVDTRQEIDPTDIGSFEFFDVKRNWLDRIPSLARADSGSAARHVVDAASMLHPVYTSAATVATDAAANFEKSMLKFASGFSDKFSKLKKSEQAQVNAYLREANAKELKIDTADLMARGFSNEQMESVRAWRKFWDGHFYLENLDLVRTLNNQGYQKLISDNADLFARPLASTQGVGKVYDPGFDRIIGSDEWQKILDQGGQLAKLRRPTQFGEDVTEHIIVRNTSDEYLRKLRDQDTALNYRDGYYQIQYKAPRFVDEIDSNGMRRAVAVAGDTKEAQAFADRMASQNPDKSYKVRADDRAMRTSSDDWFDINSASGRIAQRHRGKLLEDATGLNLLGDGSYVVSPVDSAIHAAKSISGRTITRPVIEAAKARFMQQYDRFLPSDGIGGKRFPSSSAEIGAKGERFTSDVADARTTYEYINYLENGYINGIDNVYKAGMHALADSLGNRGFSSLERGAMLASEKSLSGIAKGSVFGALIAANPLRQWVVQSHQGVRTIAYNPTGWASGSIVKLLGQYTGAKLDPLLTVSNDAKMFAKFIDDSGVMAAVDKQNLVRGTLLSAADSSTPLSRAIAFAPNMLRRVGFDAGEMGNNLVHYAAVYDRYKRMGKDLTDKAVRDEAYSEARAISYDMNFAGDMPYNQNSASMVLQFMQVPHKAMLQATNRRIDRSTRARLIVADTLFWGVPGAGAISTLLGGDILPDNPSDREAVLYGLESMMMNNYLRSVFETKDINIDFSSLAPHDMTGWGEFLKAMMTGGADQLIMNSPSGQLFFKEGGKVRNAIASVARFFGMQEDIDEDPQTAIAVLNEVAKISSGWSNGVKAYLALETGKTYDKYGKLIDDKTHPVEAYMQAFGFPSANQRDLYRASKAITEKTKEHKEEVLSVYKGVLSYYTSELERGNTDINFITKVSSFALRKYKDDPVAQQIIQQQLMIDLQDPNIKLLSMMIKASGLPNATSLKDTIRQMPDTEERKALLMQRIDDIEKLRNQKGN